MSNGRHRKPWTALTLQRDIILAATPATGKRVQR